MASPLWGVGRAWLDSAFVDGLGKWPVGSAVGCRDSTLGDCKSATLFLSSSRARGESPDPPQVGQGSTWVPVVVTLIVVPPPHRQHLAIDLPPVFLHRRDHPPQAKKKADVVEHPEVFDHVGLLVNGPPGQPGYPSSSHPTTSKPYFQSHSTSRVGISKRSPNSSTLTPIAFANRRRHRHGNSNARQSAAWVG